MVVLIRLKWNFRNFQHLVAVTKCLLPELGRAGLLNKEFKMSLRRRVVKCC